MEKQDRDKMSQISRNTENLPSHLKDVIPMEDIRDPFLY